MGILGVGDLRFSYRRMNNVPEAHSGMGLMVLFLTGAGKVLGKWLG